MQIIDMTEDNLFDSYGFLKAEVAEFRDNVRKLLMPGTREEDLYKGTMILYSELFFEPDFLFIGINPGAGFYKTSGQKFRTNELDPEDAFEYLAAENEYDYTLAKETRKAFEQTKFKNSLCRSVKINLFFTSTSSEPELHEFYEILFTKHNIDYYKISAGWTKRLIEMFQPRAIICEGKKVVDCLGDYFSVLPVWNDDVASFKISETIHVLGYKRRRSYIRNMDTFSAALNDLVI